MGRGLGSIQGQLYTCPVDAEPQQQYRPGGYHPIHLGDILKEGRYKILQKLGFGGYSTVWAARYQALQRNLAIKVSVSGIEQNIRELRMLRILSTSSSLPESGQHVVILLDEFMHAGPNDGRMPGVCAKEVSRQALLGLTYLHHLQIGHGDLHIRNLALTLPGVESLSEQELIVRLGAPKIGSVTRTEGEPLGPEVPQYLVWPSLFPISQQILYNPIKIIDFGQSFKADDKPCTLHTPPALHPPELLLGQDWGYRADPWSTGCMIFELVAGQPPFDNFFKDKEALLRQIIESVGNAPDEWEGAAALPQTGESTGDGDNNIEDWLEELYLDKERKQDLSHDDIGRLKLLLRKLICCDPNGRYMAKTVVKDIWFADS